MNSKVGVIGSGTVAKTLAAGFKSKGYDVRIASRDSGKQATLAVETGVSAGSFEDVAAFAEIIVLAVKGTGAEAACRILGSAMDGKLVIDTTNPISDEPPDHGVLRYFTTISESLMERLQSAHPNAKFVKAFNSVGGPFMVDPELPGGRPTMFIGGNHADAKMKATEILREFGWDVADMGGVETARPIEALCQLWCARGFNDGKWAHAFRLLTRD